MGTGSGKRSLVGRELGRFRIVERIASGGMATVYLAKRIGAAGFERNVAIKVLHEHLCEDEAFVGMFLDEARLTASLDHPHVVDVYDVDRIDGELVLVMRYVEGCSFSILQRAARRRNEELPLGVKLQVIHDMLGGLHHAHELADSDGNLVGVVHRDVSPQNVLVGIDGIARVADFGIAKARGRLATTQGADVVKGKYRYLAPEQAAGKSVDRRTDVFAAGIVLWEALTGRPLFDAEHEVATIRMILEAPIPSPATVAADVSEELAEVCLRALDRDPAKRFQSAEAMADALSPHLERSRPSRRAIGVLVRDFGGDKLERLKSAASARIDIPIPNDPEESFPTRVTPRARKPIVLDESESQQSVMGAVLTGTDARSTRTALTALSVVAVVGVLGLGVILMTSRTGPPAPGAPAITAVPSGPTTAVPKAPLTGTPSGTSTEPDGGVATPSSTAQSPATASASATSAPSKAPPRPAMPRPTNTISNPYGLPPTL